MPIVDGLTSTKMIRSFEKSHPTQILSTRASLNGRVPIIAVSASLVERERQTYIDTGFDGWILKPISFNRLSEIMKGIVESDVRKSNLYRPGVWEYGGWFDEAQKDVFTADTRPSGEPPLNQTGVMQPPAGVKVAAALDDPFVKEEDSSEQTQEQKRLAGAQTTGATKASRTVTQREMMDEG
jgi:CheY-like chemotaxis protein